MTAKSIWELAKAAAAKWNEINAPRLGAALAFYTMLSLAPLLVLLIAIVGLVYGPKMGQSQILAQVENLMGYQGGKFVATMLFNATRLSSGLAAAAVGVVLTLLGASTVFNELRDSLNQVWDAKKETAAGIVGIVQSRFFSIALVLGIGFLLLVSLLFSAAIAAAGKFFGEFLPLPEAALQALNALLSFFAVTVLFALLFKVVPDVHIEWRDVWVGSAVTSALFSLGKLVIGLYLGKAGVGSAYGAAGSLVVFLVWVYYSAQIFFLGAAFTQAYTERHGSLARARAARFWVTPVRPNKIA
jgi:membrane protein